MCVGVYMWVIREEKERMKKNHCSFCSKKENMKAETQYSPFYHSTVDEQTQALSPSTGHRSLIKMRLIVHSWQQNGSATPQAPQGSGESYDLPYILGLGSWERKL